MTSRKRLVGYCDPISVAPGDEIHFMISSLDEEDFDGQLVRLVCGDVSPGGHGYEEVECESVLDRRYQGRRQELRPGSFAVVPANDFVAGLEGIRIELCVYPTLLAGTRSLLSSWGPQSGDGGFGLEIDDGIPVFAVRDAAGERQELRCELAIPERRWTRLVASYDPDGQELRLSVDPRTISPGDQATMRPWSGTKQTSARVASRGPLLFAARAERDGETAHFDGRLDECRLGSHPHGDPEVRWDFSRDIGSDEITDTGVHRLHGETRQLPARAVPGVKWTGEIHDWTAGPDHYSAIHFHSDDLIDADWESTCSFVVPEDLPSGVYALRTRSNSSESSESSEDHTTFFVLPADDAEPAKVAWLAPTMTYRAYANFRLTNVPDRVFGSWAETEMPNDRFLVEHPECGLSLYEYHADGHGVMYSSLRRPVLNLKPKGGLWCFTADTNVLAWLDKTQVRHDVITDDALHERGEALLARYRTIVTGTHPEYWTTEMLDALEGYLSRGGRLMYVGANGFYWRVGLHPTVPGAMELRRAEDGTRSWAAEPGEYVMETTGELGGLWRRIGRPPNLVCGVGFAAQGFSLSGHYRRSSAWNDPRVAFATQGLSSRDILGNHGTIGGGAAGHEIDRFDSRLGSPRHAIVLASSEGHPPDMLQTKEEFLASGFAIPGTAVRADIVFFETPGGGAVFSTSSIAWAASLATDDYENDVARLTTNVLQRFVSDEPFALPEKVSRPSGLPPRDPSAKIVSLLAPPPSTLP